MSLAEIPTQRTAPTRQEQGALNLELARQHISQIDQDIERLTAERRVWEQLGHKAVEMMMGLA